MGINDRTYQPGRGAYARKDFRFSGRPFKCGEVFDARHLAVGPRKMIQMFNAGYLTHDDSVAANAPEEKESETVETETTEITRESLEEMDIADLAGAITEKELDLDPDEFETEEDLRDAIWEMLEPNQSTSTEENDDPDEVTNPEVVSKGGGWYDVKLGDQVLNETALRKDAAEEFAANYTAGE